MFGFKTAWAAGEDLKEMVKDLQTELDVANETIEKQSERLKERDETIEEQNKLVAQLRAILDCRSEDLLSIQNDLGMCIEKFKHA